MPPQDDIQLERHQREEARWLILRVLDAARPFNASENIVSKTLASSELPVTPSGIRRELTYLEDKGLLAIASRKVPVWHAKLTAYGVDVVEYTKDAPPGIARPDEA